MISVRMVMVWRGRGGRGGLSSVADPGFFPSGGRQLPKLLLFFTFLPKNCMKMKEFGPQGGAASLAPPLDPPMVMVIENVMT